jgi:hypothetical protein
LIVAFERGEFLRAAPKENEAVEVAAPRAQENRLKALDLSLALKGTVVL